MSRIAYVAGHYLPHRAAAVHIEDRGFQFADGVYEVIAVKGGHLVDEALHLGRLHRSLNELRIAPPIGDAAFRIVLREVVRRNGVTNGIVYIQLTRGVAPRDHALSDGGEADARRHVAALTSARPGLGAGRRCRHHHPRHPLAALRHQDGSAGGECARQAAGPGSGSL